MSQRPALFREEAIEFQAGRQAQGGLLRIDPAWTRWLYWIVLALVVAGVVVTATARTAETTSGPALINVQQRTFVALVPDTASPGLRRGQLVRLQVNDPVGRRLAARVLGAKVANHASVRRAGFTAGFQPAMLVTGVLAPPADVASLPSSPPPRGRAIVVLHSQRVLSLFVRLVRGMLGGGDGS
jgi:hypothetical protein